MDVIIKSFYDLSETSIMKQIMVDHYQVIMKHFQKLGHFNVENFNVDIKYFYKKWHGDKSKFVTDLSKSAISSAYTLMAEVAQLGNIDMSDIPHVNCDVVHWDEEIDNINKYYNSFWYGMRKFLNGRDTGSEWVMDDTYFDEVDDFTKQISKINFRYLNYFKNSMTIALVGEIESIYKSNM